MQFGYCTNVHSGTSLDAVMANLETYSLEVQTRLSDSEAKLPLGLGLWLSASVVDELADKAQMIRFRDWWQDHDLQPFTINGFPFGDFHKDVVKYDVYLPTWAARERLDYTRRLAEIHHELLMDGEISTISTLPVGWPQNDVADQQTREDSVANLIELARQLQEFESETGREVVVCLEPEPGCLIDTAPDMVTFFEALFQAAGDHESAVRRHIGVCHDICHSAVMHESQAAAIEAYARAEIRIGKVQVSSAIEVDFRQLQDSERQTAVDQLSGFAEPKFLHQTVVEIDGQTTMFHDLHLALSSAMAEPENLSRALWRVHYHVPIYLDKVGNLGTTQSEIEQCQTALKLFNVEVAHFEVETYAWNELPRELQVPELADGIARELRWWREQQASWK